jgi:hypothetical protein
MSDRPVRDDDAGTLWVGCVVPLDQGPRDDVDSRIVREFEIAIRESRRRNQKGSRVRGGQPSLWAILENALRDRSPGETLDLEGDRFRFFENRSFAGHFTVL